MVLAVSDESPEVVKKYVERMKIQLPVGAGFTGGQDWGVAYYPSAALVNPDGKLLWLGHPSKLTPAMVEGALSGANPAE